MGRTDEALWAKSKTAAKTKMGGKHSAVCSTCKKVTPLEDFTSNKHRPSGKMTYCKDCNNARNKRYRGDDMNLERACKRLLGYIARRVRTKGHEIDFDSTYLEELFLKQEGLCYYTKDEMKLGANSPKTLSVDRINSDLGYLKSNVCLTTWEVNNCKQHLSVGNFLALCQKVVDNVKDK